jgi:hypothetical protein
VLRKTIANWIAMPQLTTAVRRQESIANQKPPKTWVQILGASDAQMIVIKIQ